MTLGRGTDAIAFPKTQIGQDLMTRAPSTVPEKQLNDLHVKSTWDPAAAAAPKQG